MSGMPRGGNLLIMTMEEAKQWAKDAAASIDARLHGGQSGGKRTEIIETEILSQMEKFNS